jgi:hypothetical protein
MAKPGKTGRSKLVRAAPARIRATAKAPTKARAKAAPPPASHAERFDRSSYEVPLIDLGEAIALATALLAATPARATPAIAEEARQVAAARDRARVVKKTSPAAAASLDARPFDVAMDRAWATFVRRIEDHVELGRPNRADASDLATIHGIIRDLSILKLNYLAEFAQIGARLDALKREGLLAAACVLTGGEFFDEVLRCHGEYGDALGVGPIAATSTMAIDQGQARLALIEAIAEYAVQLMALARAGRPESWNAVHRALKPIADLRAQQAKKQCARPPAPAREAHPPVAPRAEL